MAVCFDTQVLIWGIKEDATPGQGHMVAKTKAFIGFLDQKQEKVIIPAIVVGEFLLRVPPEFHATINNLLARSFIIAPYDMQAAAHFSRIWQQQKQSGVIDELKQIEVTQLSEKCYT